MRAFFAIAFAAVMLSGCSIYPATFSSPFELKPDKDSSGLVIIAIDDEVPTSPGYASDLNIHWYDPAKNVPYYRPTSLSRANLQLVTDSNGHRFLVGQIGQGEAIISSLTNQRKWSMCYNSGTYHFFVKGGAYNFIGHFDDGPSYKALDDAVTAGKLPASVPEDEMAGIILDQTLTGFTPGENRPGDKERVAALLAAKLGHPVDIVTPTLTRTDFNLSKASASSPPQQCEYYSDLITEWPDRSKPAPLAPPAAPVAPAADGAPAKPAATITWVSRPKVPTPAQ
jgi:hypothetical protein